MLTTRSKKAFSEDSGPPAFPHCCSVPHLAFSLPPPGNTCQNGLLPALVRPTLPSVQTSLSMKQFLPIPLDTASTVGLFPGFNTVSVVFHLFASRALLAAARRGSTLAEVTLQRLAAV